jgi:acyl-CoA hydrolase
MDRYDVVEDESDLIGGISDDFPLQEVIVTREDFL